MAREEADLQNHPGRHPSVPLHLANTVRQYGLSLDLPSGGRLPRASSTRHTSRIQSRCLSTAVVGQRAG